MLNHLNNHMYYYIAVGTILLLIIIYIWHKYVVKNTGKVKYVHSKRKPTHISQDQNISPQSINNWNNSIYGYTASTLPLVDL